MDVEAAHGRARSFLLVAALAPLGVTLRHIVSVRFGIGRVTGPFSALPTSLATNLFGTALLGLLDALTDVLPSSLRTGLASGFCASLTSALLYPSCLC